MRAGRAAVAAMLISGAGPAFGQVIEVQHPEVERGEFEVEVLSGVVPGDVAAGEDRAAHEFAIGYAPLGFWKTKAAVEIVRPGGGAYEVEALEWENILLLPIGDRDHHHHHGHSGEAISLHAVALYGGLEIPNEGGIGAGALTFGPITEAVFGPVTTIANLFVEVPFENGEDPGLAYALGVEVPVASRHPLDLAIGFEVHGTVEGAFGRGPSLSQTQHLAGPAVYAGIDPSSGRAVEPRFAVLFGLTDGSPDVLASFNIELKF